MTIREITNTIEEIAPLKYAEDFDNEEWNLNWDSVPWQMTSLIQYIIRIPEYQLM